MARAAATLLVADVDSVLAAPHYLSKSISQGDAIAASNKYESQA